MSDEQSWRPKANKWLIALVVTLAAFMEVLDTTIVVVSLRHIAGAMSVSYDEATWTLTSYLIANGVVLTISGWLARVLGRKRYFLISIGMFSVASLLCGLSQNLLQLVVARLIQGFFGGGLQPIQQSILLDTFPQSERARAFGIVAIAIVVAPVLGPTLGGWITDNYSWRWVFLLNVPVGIATVFAVQQLIEDPPWAKARGLQNLDVIGLSLITLGLGCLEITVDRGEESDWLSSNMIRMTAAMAITGILGTIAWLLYKKDPFINIRVFRDRNFTFAAILMGGVAGILYGTITILPQLSQQYLGYDATHAGLFMTPGALLVILLIPLVIWLQRNFATRYIICFGFTLLGLALVYSYQVLFPQITFEGLILLRAAQGAGLAFLFAPLSTIAFADTTQENRGDASALFIMMRNVVGSVGISATSALALNRTQIRMAHLSAHVTPLDQGFQFMLQRVQEGAGSAANALGAIYQNFLLQSAILAYRDTMAILAILSFCLAPLALFLTAKKVSGGNAGH